jgi:histidinol-phosphate phosphatase family protein
MGMRQTLPQAVLFDRDGTLVEDVPYNRDPERVRPMPGAARLLDGLRRRGVRCGIVSNQSGIARGLITPAELAAVSARIDSLLGPFDVFMYCPHAAEDRCRCRKPEPGLVLDACLALGVDPCRSLVVGDIGADMGAAAAAGASGILVPTPVTRPEEVASSGRVAASLELLPGMLWGSAW